MTLALSDWSILSEPERRALLSRPAAEAAPMVDAAVAEILRDVRERGDRAVRELTARFDRVDLADCRVSADEFAWAETMLAEEDLAAIDRAIETVTRFHAAQQPAPLRIETAPGVICERLAVPIDAVGLYVPAGSAALPSTAIMTAVPALLAGCPTRILVTPPRPDGRANPAVLAAAQRIGITAAYKIGGAQAIAALAYGTESIPKVDKICGPGNQWVTAAKLQVARDPAGAAYDLPAGPSEVLVIADESARADFVAADLLAQAEHDPNAQVILVTPSRRLAVAVSDAVESQLARLPRSAIAREALAKSRIILVDSLETACDLSNRYAPEHLIIAVERARDWLPKLRAAGSIFLGHWSPESVGDYCSGTNHVLPTYGYARAYSGLSVDSFLRRITVQELTPAGLQELGPTTVRLATLEGLDAHAEAVRVRLAALASP
jgi:histidinol dehydrogenase